MSDYDIVIKLDPAQPVAGAQKVTGAVGDIEKQAESAQKALNDMAAGTKATADEVKKLRENTSGVKDGIGKMLQESAKGFGMQALHNGLMQVGSTLEDVTGGAFNFQHAMLGFAVAGPVGAAVGGFIGLLDNLGGDLFHTDELLKQVEETGKRNAQMWTDMVHGVLNVEAAFAKQRQVLEDVNFQLKTQNALIEAQRRLGVFGRGQNATLSGQLAGVGQGALDARGGGFGAAGDFFEQQRQAAIAAGKAWDDEMKKLASDQAKALTDELIKRLETSNGTMFAPRNQIGGFSVRGGFRDLQSASGPYDSTPFATPDIGALGSDTSDPLAKYNAELVQHQQRLDAIRQHLQPIQDGLVELATTGQLSWSRMIDAMIADLARLATDKLFTSLLNMISPGPTAPGIGGLASSIGSVVGGGSHATGGSFTAPSTGGGVDSILMLSRVSPGERVDYTPRGQAYGGGQPAYASAPRVMVQVVDQRDSRALAPSQSDHRMFVELARQNAGFLRGLVR